MARTTPPPPISSFLPKSPHVNFVMPMSFRQAEWSREREASRFILSIVQMRDWGFADDLIHQYIEICRTRTWFIVFVEAIERAIKEDGYDIQAAIAENDEREKHAAKAKRRKLNRQRKKKYQRK